MRNGPYIFVIAPDGYPGNRYRGKYIYEHHLAWWLATGQTINTDEVIHHKNGNKHDNQIDNLECVNRGAHTKHHMNENHPRALVSCCYCNKFFLGIPSKLNSRRKKNKGRLYCSLSCGAMAQHQRFKKQVLTHGTRSAYMTGKCRCEPCREWNNLRMQAYFARKRAQRTNRSGGA